MNSHVREHNGVTFTTFKTDEEFEAVFCVDDQRFVLKGFFQIIVMNGSWKFGNQIQFKLYANKTSGFKVEQRNASDFNTCEIDLPFEKAKELLKCLNMN